MWNRVIAASCIALVVGCSGGGSGGAPEEGKKSSKELLEQASSFENKEEFKVFVGDEFVNPLSRLGKGEVAYTSSEETVAKVDNKGNVSVIAPGKASITASIKADDTYKGTELSFGLIAIDRSLTFAGWMSESGTQLSFPADSEGVSLYLSNEEKCDIANYAACLNGGLYELKADSTKEQASALKKEAIAYLTAEYGQHRTEVLLSGQQLHTGKGKQTVLFKGQLWSIGGSIRRRGDRSTEGSQYVWSSKDGLNWLKAAEVPLFKGREGHAVIVFQEHIWVIAGITNNGEYVERSDVWKSADGKKWQLVTEVADFPKQGYHQAFAFNNRLWLSGKSDKKGDLWSSEDGEDWQLENDNMPMGERQAHKIIEFNDELFLLGGQSGIEEKNDVWKSVNGKDWQLVTNSAPWEGRTHHKAIVYKNKLWLIGGFKESGENFPNFSEVWNTTDGENWQLVTDAAAFQSGHGGSVIILDDRLTYIQDVILSDSRTYYGQNRVWQTVDGKDWQIISNESAPSRSSHQVVAFKDKLWLYGGLEVGEQLKSDIWSSEDGLSWNRESSEAEFGPRAAHQVVEFNDELWMFSGVSRIGLRNRNNDAWKTTDNDLADIWRSRDGITWAKEFSSQLYASCENYRALSFKGKLWLLSGQGRGPFNKSNFNSPTCVSDERQMWMSVDGVNWQDVKGEDNFNFPDLKGAEFVVYKDKIWAVANQGAGDIWSFDGSTPWKLEVESINCGDAEDNCFDRAGHRLHVFDGKLWLIGQGLIENNASMVQASDVWSSEDGTTWSRETASANYKASINSPIVTFDNKMMIIGGWFNFQYRSGAVWSTENGVDWSKGYKHTLRFEK